MTQTPEKLTPVKPGRLNKPAWFRERVAEFGPVRKEPGQQTPTVYDVYLDGTLIGAVSGDLKNPGSTLRTWTPDRIAAGVKQHGTTRFEAVDALVRSYLTETRQHPIAA